VLPDWKRSVAAIGAPKRATEDATAMLLGLSGADVSWPMHDTYGLALERIPEVIANTVQLIVDQLKLQARGRGTSGTRTGPGSSPQQSN
jgi:predicted transcriptional regulator